MGLAGNLEDVALVEVLQVLAVTGQSGVLRVSRPGYGAEVVFARGRVLTVQVAPPRRHLAAYFLEREWIDFETLHRALVQQSQAARHKLTGQILVELGAITRDQLLQGLRVHVRDLMVELLRWDSGEFTFSGRADPDACPDESERFGVPLDTDELERLAEEARAGPDQTIAGEALERASWPARPRLAIVVTGDVLIGHGVDQSLRGAAFSVVQAPDLESVSGLLLASEDQQPSLAVDLDAYAHEEEARAALAALRRLRDSWPNVNLITFGRQVPAAFFAFLRESVVAFHLPRPPVAAEADIRVVRDFVEALAEVIVRAREPRRISNIM